MLSQTCQGNSPPRWRDVGPRIVLTLLLIIGPAISAYANTSIRVLGLFKDRAVVTINGKQRLLRVGRTTPDGIELLSATSREAVIEVNGLRQHYQLGTHIHNSYAPPAEAPSVKIWETDKAVFTVDGSINGSSATFLVDTGASVVTLNSQVAKRIGLDYLAGQRATSMTASGIVDSYRVTLDTVKIGSIVLRNVEGAVLEGYFPQRVLLGMSFLNQVEMRRDSGVLELRKKF
jgi:aspartyl protease family protein